MNVVILQPSYIPWRGYFHQIARADLFIFYDDVKYDKNGWRNRNRIKTPRGARWLTIPVHSSGVETNHTPICEIRADASRAWAASHLSSIRQAYGQAPFFQPVYALLRELYAEQPALLADFTVPTTIALARALGIQHTRFLRSSSMRGIQGTKTRRLIEILTQVGATHYISGPSARDYIEEDLFREAGIGLEYMRYDYPPYPQLYPPYDPQVSIIDLMCMTGPDALRHILH
mgnify:CR=1 FL=1